MKQHIFTAALCAMASLWASAADVSFNGAENLTSGRVEQNYVLSMNINPAAMHPGRDREIIITPVLRALEGNDSIIMPTVRVSGRNRYYSHLRNNDLPAAERMIEAGSKEPVGYRFETPWQRWMNRSELDFPVDPGRYHLMAWCGEGHTSSFTVNSDAEHIDDIHCRLNREYISRAEQIAVSSANLSDLYHGRQENLVMPDEQGVHYYTVPLTKDTNTISILLQQLSGEPMNPDDFDMEITDTNGHLESDNTMRGDEIIHYNPWKQGSSLSDIVYPGAEFKPTELGAVMAEFRVSRLMLQNNPRLTVSKHADGTILFSIPLKPYMVQFAGDQFSNMDTQEYLDRQDEYKMMFFLDEGMRWMNAYIYINSFKVVLQNVDL